MRGYGESKDVGVGGNLLFPKYKGMDQGSGYGSPWSGSGLVGTPGHLPIMPFWLLAAASVPLCKI